MNAKTYLYASDFFLQGLFFTVILRAFTVYLRLIPLKVRAISAKIITNNLLTAYELFEYYLKLLTVVHFSRWPRDENPKHSREI